jgi:hypothetical protein
VQIICLNDLLINAGIGLVARRYTFSSCIKSFLRDGDQNCIHHSRCDVTNAFHSFNMLYLVLYVIFLFIIPSILFTLFAAAVHSLLVFKSLQIIISIYFSSVNLLEAALPCDSHGDD